MNPNQNPVVNVPKKSNGVKIMVGVYVLCCCVFSALIIYGISRKSGRFGGSTGGNDPKPLSTKQVNVQLYKTLDCSGKPEYTVWWNKGVPLDTKIIIDKRGRGNKHFACCMKAENVDINATYTTGFESEKAETTLNIKDVDKIILTKDHVAPSGESIDFNKHMHCARDLHIKAHPLK